MTPLHKPVKRQTDVLVRNGKHRGRNIIVTLVQCNAVVTLYAQRGEAAEKRKLHLLIARSIVKRVQRKLYWDITRFSRNDEQIADVCRQAWHDAECIFSL